VAPELADTPVELLRWPSEDGRRGVLARSGVPCLLLVEPDADLPRSIGPAEDWIRLPADEADIAARAVALCRRLATHAATAPVVRDGVLHHGGESTMLQPAEATFVQTLLDAGTVLSREGLEAALWPDGAPTPRSLEALVYRLRLRLRPLNVHVVAARGRGYAIDVGPVVSVPSR
jgi:DNA-binding response OmpR family regulator